MKRITTLLLLVLFAFTWSPAKAQHCKVDVRVAGTLRTIVTTPDCDSITISGSLNEQDFYFLRTEMPSLKYLNMLGVSVPDNRIPNFALENNKTLSEVVLPASLQIVGYQAFDRCNSLEKVVFPKTLKAIDQEGFSECNFSGELALPDSLETLGTGAFDVNHITKTIFPDKLREIGDWAFRYCYNLEEVTLPDSLKSIGGSAFNDCYRLRKVTLKSKTPPTISSSSFNYTKIFYVPVGTGEVYSKTVNWNNLVIIDGNTPVKVEVTLTEAGTLGEEILKQLDYVNKVNELVVSGPLNDDDYYQVQNRMPNLISLDMTNAIMESLPDNFLSQRGALLEVKLPNTLKSIGSYAFNECNGLTSMKLPEGLTGIGYGAFMHCRSLTKVDLPISLMNIGGYAFQDCFSLPSIVIPNKVTILENATFYNCNALANVALSSNLIEIKNNVFYNCSALLSIELPATLVKLGMAFNTCNGLTEVTLPASLQYCNQPFYYCNNIRRVNCNASVPPVLNGNDILYGVDKSSCELYVPFWSVNEYKLTPGWDVFPVINPSDYEVDEMTIHKSLTLAAGVRPTSNPIVSLVTNGQFIVRGEDAFSMRKYTQSHRLEMYDWYNELGDNDRSTYTGLISESISMRADSVIYDMSVNGRYWMYLSFPFDVKVSDIEVSDEALFVIRKYDGATRAKGGTSNWKNMTNDSTLVAGEGYIMQFNKAVAHFVLKAINNDNKNRLFSGSALSKPLGEYVSEFEHNRSWNFVGNPYPCYFDIHYLDYNSPLTIWNGRGYTALSPEDDDFVLRPMQAFFVQKPVDTDAIGFAPEGRQMNTTIRERVMGVHCTESDNGRSIYNLTFGNDEYKDKTRIVINSGMSIGYDMARDAAKFMSSDFEIPQFYTLDATDIRYAINERPIADGIILLGITVGKAGAYTIALDESLQSSGDVVLVDKLLKNETRLNVEDYTFTTDAGTFDDRFEVRINITPTGIGQEAVSLNPVQVLSGKGRVKVRTEAGNEIIVCNAAGQIQQKIITTDEVTIISLEPGFYIVKVAEESFKTLVTK